MTTAYGVDYAWERPDHDALARDGKTFAIRYLSYDTSGKNLTRAEADQLAERGIMVVSNWEYAERAALSGYQQGVADAHAAQAQHADCGGGPNRPIYFSLDWDVQPGELGQVGAYLDGCAAVLGRQRVGAYGGALAINYAMTLRKAAWLWQTYAWSHELWVPGVHIRQVANEVPFHGTHIDMDEAQRPDFGQWTPLDHDLPIPAGKDTMLTHWINFRQGDGTPAHPSPFVARGQALLNVASAYDENGHPLAVDGIAGPHTDYAIRLLQRAHGLAVDGIFGPHTLSVALYGTDYA